MDVRKKKRNANRLGAGGNEIQKRLQNWRENGRTTDLCFGEMHHNVTLPVIGFLTNPILPHLFVVLDVPENR